MAAFARPFVPLLSQFGARETVELRRVVKGAGVNTGGRLVDIVTAASSSVDQVVAAIGTLPHMCSCCCGCMRACGCTCVVVCVAVCGCGVHGPFVDVIVRLVAFVNARACMRVPTWLVHRCLEVQTIPSAAANPCRRSPRCLRFDPWYRCVWWSAFAAAHVPPLSPGHHHFRVLDRVPGVHGGHVRECGASQGAGARGGRHGCVDCCKG